MPPLHAGGGLRPRDAVHTLQPYSGSSDKAALEIPGPLQCLTFLWAIVFVLDPWPVMTFSGDI